MHVRTWETNDSDGNIEFTISKLKRALGLMVLQIVYNSG